MSVEPSPSTKVLDATKPLTPGDLARLQNTRAAAQRWVDACEVDLAEAERVREQREEELGRARAALRKASDELQGNRARSAGLRAA
jgi:hypothetical protein